MSHRLDAFALSPVSNVRALLHSKTVFPHKYMVSLMTGKRLVRAWLSYFGNVIFIIFISSVQDLLGIFPWLSFFVLRASTLVLACVLLLLFSQFKGTCFILLHGS